MGDIKKLYQLTNKISNEPAPPTKEAKTESNLLPDEQEYVDIFGSLPEDDNQYRELFGRDRTKPVSGPSPTITPLNPEPEVGKPSAVTQLTERPWEKDAMLPQTNVRPPLQQEMEDYTAYDRDQYVQAGNDMLNNAPDLSVQKLENPLSVQPRDVQEVFADMEQHKAQQEAKNDFIKASLQSIDDSSKKAAQDFLDGKLTNQQMNKSEEWFDKAKGIIEKFKDYDKNPEGFWQGIKQSDWKDILSLGLEGIQESYDIYSISKKAEKGKELTPGEQAALTASALLRQVQSEKPADFGYKTAQILTNMIPFMGQLALTGGAGSILEKGGEAAIKQGAKAYFKQLPKLMLEQAVYDAPRTLAMPMFYSSALQNMTPDVALNNEGQGYFMQGSQDGVLKGLGKSALTTFGERYFEGYGGILDNALLPSMKMIGTKLGAGVMFDAAKKNTFIQALNQFRKASGLNSAPGELLEEDLNGLYTPLVDNNQKFSDTFNWETQGQIVLSSLVMNGAFRLAQISSNTKDYYSITRPYRKATDQIVKMFGNDAQTIIDANNIDDLKQREDAMVQIAPLAKTPEQRIAILNFFGRKVQYDMLNGALQEKVKQEVDPMINGETGAVHPVTIRNMRDENDEPQIGYVRKDVDEKQSLVYVPSEGKVIPMAPQELNRQNPVDANQFAQDVHNTRMGEVENEDLQDEVSGKLQPAKQILFPNPQTGEVQPFVISEILPDGTIYADSNNGSVEINPQMYSSIQFPEDVSNVPQNSPNTPETSAPEQETRENIVPQQTESQPNTTETPKPVQTWKVGNKELPIQEMEDGSTLISFEDGKDETKAIQKEVDETQFDVIPITEEQPIPNAPAFAKKKTETIVKGVKIVPKKQVADLPSGETVNGSEGKPVQANDTAGENVNSGEPVAESETPATPTGGESGTDNAAQPEAAQSQPVNSNGHEKEIGITQEGLQADHINNNNNGFISDGSTQPAVSTPIPESLTNEATKPETSENKEVKATENVHKLVSEERYQELKARLKAKLGNLNAGFDPELLAIGTEMAAFHIEGGARKFVDFAKSMIADLGENIKPYLKSFYLGAKNLPGLNTEGMDKASYVEDFDLDSLAKETNQPNQEDDPLYFAKKFLYSAVKNKTSIEDIKRGQGGFISDGRRVQIGGYVDGKHVSSDYVITEINDQIKLFKLKDLYDELKAEIDNEDKTPTEQLGEMIDNHISNTEVKREEAKVNTEPSDAQKEAGNYQKGHVKIQGLNISIENPKGSVRSGEDDNGKHWETKMNHTYGQILGTKGIDGDPIDIFIGDQPALKSVFVINQVKPGTGKIDEHKVMFGFPSMEEAKKAYLSNYEEGWKGLGSIIEMPVSRFKKWVYDEELTSKPAEEIKPSRKLPVGFPKELAGVLNHTPRTPEEDVLQFIAGGGRFDSDLVSRELGKKAIKNYNIIGVVKKNGAKLDTFFEESPWADEWGNSNGANDLIIDTITKYNSVSKAANRLNELINPSETERINPEILENWENEQNIDSLTDEEFEETFSLSEEDFITLQNIIAENVNQGPEIRSSQETETTSGTASDQGENSPGRSLFEDRQNGSGNEEQSLPRQVNLDPQSQKKVKEIDDKISAIEKRISETRKSREKKYAELNNRNGLFGDTQGDENQLSNGTFQVSPEIIKKALSKFDGDIAEGEKEIDRLKKLRQSTIDNSGNQQDLFGQLDEHLKPKEQSGKEPWQMTKKEWEAEIESLRGQNVQSNVTKSSKNEDISRVRKLVWLLDGVHDKEKQELQDAIDGKIQITPERANELDEIINTHVLHRDVIEKALDEGNPVPKEVLKDYPELKSEVNQEQEQEEQPQKETTVFDNLDDLLTEKPIDETPAETTQEVITTVIEDQKAEAESDDDLVLADEDEIQTIQDFGDKIGGARKDLADSGFKGAKVERDNNPAWMRGFELGENEDGTFSPFKANGRFILWQSKTSYKTKEEAKNAIKLLFVASKYRPGIDREGKYYIYRRITDRKYQVMKDGFESRDEALRWMAENADMLANYKPEFPERPHIEDLQRTGKEYRNGNVTPKQFTETFGFKGGEFGNWIPQDERQRLLNFAYDGLMDLADILGVPPKAISLGGQLSIAWGARGHGLSGAAAHYERERAVFNLTRMKGAGSVAHEWFHALDHYFGMQDKGKTLQKNEKGLVESKGRDNDFLSHGHSYKSNVRKETLDAYISLIQTIYKQPHIVEVSLSRYENIQKRSQEDLDNGIKNLRNHIANERRYGRKKKPATEEQLKRYDKLIDRIRKGDFGEDAEIKTQERHFNTLYTKQVFKDLNDLITEITGRSAYRREDGRRSGDVYNLENVVNRLNDAIKQLEHYRKDNKEEQLSPTRYLYDAKDIDKLRASDYWSTEHEMAARAFESYIEDMVTLSGNKSQYLVHSTYSSIYKLLYNLNPYPEGEERGRINEAFKKFFNILQTKEENGNVVMYRKTDPFYSNTEHALESISQEKATPEQWKAMLQKNGAKQAEMDWIGIDEFLGDKKTVSKQELADFIAENKIQLQEIVKENKSKESLTHAERLENGNWVLVYNDGGRADSEEFSSEDELNDYYSFMPNDDSEPEGTKFQAYKLPGGKEYKEWLITIPNKKFDTTRIAQAQIAYNHDKISREEWDKIRKDEEAKRALSFQSFKSPHWDEPNIVAHIRTQEFTDKDGKRVLLVEEVQSDWQQEGRKKGFKNDKAEKRIEELSSELKLKYPDEKFSDILLMKGEPLVEELSSLYDDKSYNRVPDMPFKNTDQIIGLGMKRMLRYAAENGFDKVAWTTGDQQAERYDLSKQIDEIAYRKNDDETYHYQVLRNTEYVTGSEKAKISEIEETVGKEIAQKIQNGEGEEYNFQGKKTKSLSGIDLKVGGEGMIGFYDQMIPTWMNKYVKKWGSKVGTTEIDVQPEIDGHVNTDTGELAEVPEGKFQTVHSVDVTPEMKESVLKGQPMFRDYISFEEDSKFSKYTNTEELKQAMQGYYNEIRSGAEIKVVMNKREALKHYKENGGTNETVEDTIKKINSSTTAFFVPDIQVVYVMAQIAKDVPNVVWIHENVHFGAFKTLDLSRRGELLRKVYDQIGKSAINDNLPKDYREEKKEIKAEEYLTFKAELNFMNGKININDYFTQEELLHLSDINDDTVNKIINTFVRAAYLNTQNYDHQKEQSGNIPRDTRLSGTNENERDVFGRRIGLLSGNESQGSGQLGRLPEGDREVSASGRSGIKDEGDEFDIPDTIDVDGVSRPTTNNEGKPIFNTRSAIVNFWRWFGDSKVVDKKGRPIVVYHGTTENFSVFNKKRISHLTPRNAVGYYYSSKDFADTYGDDSMPVYLKITNPHSEHKKVFSISPNSEDYKTLGYDGIVTTERGNPVWVIFDSDQVKSAEFNKSYNKATSDIYLRKTPVEPPVLPSEPFDPFERLSDQLKPKKILTAFDLFREGIQDNMIAWKKIQEEEGLKVKDSSNVYLADNQKNSKAQARFEKYNDQLFSPALEHISSLFKSGKNMDMKPYIELEKRFNAGELTKSELQAETDKLDANNIPRYMIAKHAPERNATKREEELKRYQDQLMSKLEADRINGKIESPEKYAEELKKVNEKVSKKEKQLADVVYSGMTDEQANNIVTNFEKDVPAATIINLWETWGKATDEVQKMWVEYGKFDMETYTKNKKRGWKYYVPLRGWEETAEDIDWDYNKEGKKGNFNGVAQMKGRRSIADDPISNMFQIAQSAIKWGEKNRVFQAALRMVRDNANRPDLFYQQKVVYMSDLEGTWSEVIADGDNIYEIKGYDQNGNMDLRLMGAKSDLTKQGHEIKTKRNIDHEIRKPKQEIDQHEVEVMMNGEKYIIVTRDPKLANELKKTELYSMGGFLAVFSKITRTVSALRTAKNPAWVLKNTLRDFQGAIHNTWIEEDTKTSALFSKNFANALAFLVRGKEGQEKSRYLKLWDEFIAGGGRTGTTNLQSLDDIKADLKKEIRKINMKWYAKTRPDRVVTGVLKGIDKVAQISENLTRFAAYVTAREQGKSIPMAINAAKEISVNFDRKGNWSTAIGALVGFFNASIQGGVKQMQLAKHHPLRYGISAGVGLASFGYIMSMLYDLLWDDDDEKENFRTQNKYNRYNYMIIAPGKGSLMIPYAQGYRFYNAIGCVVYDLVHGKTDEATATYDLIDQLSAAISPVDFPSLWDKETKDIKLGSFFKFVSVAEPFISIADNEDYNGSIIHREAFTKEMEKYTPKSQLYLRNVNPWLKALTDNVYRFGGGDPELNSRIVFKDGKRKEVAGIWDWNPSNIEYVIKTLGAGPGTFVLDAITMASKIGEKQQEKELKDRIFGDITTGFDYTTVPILNSFYRSKYKGRVDQEYRDLKLWYEKQDKGIREYSKDERYDAIMDTVLTDPEYDKYLDMKDTEKYLKKLYEEKKAYKPEDPIQEEIDKDIQEEKIYIISKYMKP